MQDLFTPKKNPKIRPYDILDKHHESAKYDDKILIALDGINFLPM